MNTASIKTMLLGIVFMLLGSILKSTSSTVLVDVGLGLALAGFLFGVAGYFKKD